MENIENGFHKDNRIYAWWHSRRIPRFCPTCFWFQAVNYALPYNPEEIHNRYCMNKAKCVRYSGWKYEPVVEFRKNYGQYVTVKGGRPSGKARIREELGAEPSASHRLQQNRP